MEKIAFAGRRAELAHHHDIAVARQAGATALEVVAIYELAARAIEQDIVGYADRLVGAVARQGSHRFARHLSAKLLVEPFGLFGRSRRRARPARSGRRGARAQCDVRGQQRGGSTAAGADEWEDSRDS